MQSDRQPKADDSKEYQKAFRGKVFKLLNMGYDRLDAVCSNTHPIGKYLGSAGLGEFLSGNYARDKLEAGMIGYVQSDTPKSWAEKAQKKFDKEPKLVRACSDGSWTSITIIGELSHCFRSKHHRITKKRPITLYHVFLIFY